MLAACSLAVLLEDFACCPVPAMDAPSLVSWPLHPVLDPFPLHFPGEKILLHFLCFRST